MLLEKTFGNLLIRIEYIGSTAVEGLIAKPTVDILREVDLSASPAAVRQTTERCGYTVMSEKTVREYRLYPQKFVDYRKMLTAFCCSEIVSKTVMGTVRE